MIRENDGNLFSPVSVCFTFSTDYGGNLLSDRSQDFVSRSVSVTVVEGFEAVEINHHKADWRIIALSISDLREISIKLSTLKYSGDCVDEPSSRGSFARLVGEHGSEVRLRDCLSFRTDDDPIIRIDKVSPSRIYQPCSSQFVPHPNESLLLRWKHFFPKPHLKFTPA